MRRQIRVPVATNARFKRFVVIVSGVVDGEEGVRESSVQRRLRTLEAANAPHGQALPVQRAGWPLERLPGLDANRPGWVG